MSNKLHAWLLVLCVLCLFFGLAGNFYREQVKPFLHLAVKTEPPPPVPTPAPRPRPV